MSTDSRLSAHQQHLQQLAEALDAADDSLDEWVYVDLPSTFVPTQTPPDEREGQGWHRTLHLLPQVLVFLPILITWIGLSAASLAYNSMLTSGTDLGGRNFLELWQSGFDGRIPALLTFDRVAMLTVLTIVMVLVVGMWSAIDRRTQDERADHLDEVFRQQVNASLLSASRVLSMRRMESPERFRSELTKAASELTGIHAEAKKLQASARSAVTASSKATDEITAASTQLAEVLSAIAQRMSDLQAVALTLTHVQGQLTSAITATEASAATIATSVSASTSEIGRVLQAESVRSSTEMGNVLAPFGATLNDSLTQLRQELDDLTSAFQSGNSTYEAAIDVAGRVIDSAALTNDGTVAAAALISKTASSIPDIAALDRMTFALDRLITQMSTTAAATSEASARLESTGQLMESTARQFALHLPTRPETS